MKTFTTLLALALLTFGVLDIINGAIGVGTICLLAAAMFSVVRKKIN